MMKKSLQWMFILLMVWIAITASHTVGASPVSIKDVARKLAPVVHLHSQDPHRPASVGWYLKRANVLKGSGSVGSFTKYGGKFGFPDSLSVVPVDGPLDGGKLAKITSQILNGKGTNQANPDYSLTPAAAAPGQQPVYHFSDKTPFSDYQLETLNGEPLSGNKCVAEAYVRISVTTDSYYLITYWFFYPYNGGMGPFTHWDDVALSDGSGYFAHIGDWERVTAKVAVNQDKISLINVNFEWHGNNNYVTSGGNSFADKTIDQLTPLQVYSCWHSHASHETAGKFDTDSSLANDYADDDGPVWNTQDKLVFISDKGPDWVQYNGLWGANLTVGETTIDLYFKKWTVIAMGSGPAGPAFHDSWMDGIQWYEAIIFPTPKPGPTPVVQ